jgi:hypothetical protein
VPSKEEEEEEEDEEEDSLVCQFNTKTMQDSCLVS